MRAKQIVVPTINKRCKNRRISRKRAHSPVRLQATVDPDQQFPRPTLVFRRRYPSLTFPVPPIRVPVYWFDQTMVTRRLILPIPPDTFVVDGRRFKVLAQDRKNIGRFGYVRWLVYEEAAVPKGEHP